jgi:hypothetical protein
MRLHLVLHVDVPKTSAQPQNDVAALLEHFAWGLRCEAEGLGPLVFREGQAVSVGTSSMRIVELKHAD